MRASVVLAVAALMAPRPALAQPAAPVAATQEAKAPKRDKGIPEHFNGIALTDSQKVKVRELYHLYHTQMTQIRVTTKKKNDDGQNVPMPPKIKKQLDDLETKEMAEFRALLTANQTAIFDKNIAKEKADEAKRAVDKAANP